MIIARGSSQRLAYKHQQHFYTSNTTHEMRLRKISVVVVVVVVVVPLLLLLLMFECLYTTSWSRHSELETAVPNPLHLLANVASGRCSFHPLPHIATSPSRSTVNTMWSGSEIKTRRR